MPLCPGIPAPTHLERVFFPTGLWCVSDVDGQRLLVSPPQVGGYTIVFVVILVATIAWAAAAVYLLYGPARTSSTGTALVQET